MENFNKLLAGLNIYFIDFKTLKTMKQK